MSTGLARCGSSLIMQMLSAGGVPCLGGYPAFEGHAVVQPGQAVKILDPHRPDPIPYAIPPGARVIWLDKFVRTLTGFGYDRAGRRRAVASMAKDRGPAVAGAALSSRAGPKR